jgi:glycosyltransferase involved in cell wall biosynthesis
VTDDIARTDNAAWARATPRLSVLIPFFRDDPVPLLKALDEEAIGLAGAVEIVVLDDGGGDEALAARVGAAVRELALPARLARLPQNEGRAKGRNRLAAESRGAHLLFLDSDMAPGSRSFLANHLALVDAGGLDVAFGGFSVPMGEITPSHRLHRALALRGECAGAAIRQLTPEKYVFTSNLLVRRWVFSAEAFDEGFTGWGWEDVEWGMRVASRWSVVHFDNPAVHLGLDPAPVLAAKYEQSVGNFARVAKRHPEIVRNYPSYKVAKLIRRAPFRALWRALFKGAALNAHAPLSARVAALKLYRAALYAEVV